jgi:hypothetical protein
MIASLTTDIPEPWTTGSSEFDLILTCSRTHLTSEQLARLQTLLQTDLDWERLFAIATHHGVNHLLYWQLQAHAAAAIPITVREAGQVALRANCDRNLALLTELLRLNKTFAAQSLRLLSFKGPTLTHQLYGQLALRSFTDLDVLVSEAEALAAMQLLQTQGYTPQFELSRDQQARYIQIRNELSFWHEAKQIAVDLHWDLMSRHYSFSPDPALVWSAAVPLTIAGQSILTLTPEALLMYLCAHGAQHDWNKLFWICDIAELLQQHPDLDWNWIMQHINRFGTATMLFLGLSLAHEVLGAPLPEATQQELAAHPQIAACTAQVKDILLQQKKTNHTSIRTHRLYFQTLDHPRDKVWSWLDAILTPTPLEWQLISLPRPLWFLYYPLRLLRLGIKYTSFGCRSK